MHTPDLSDEELDALFRQGAERYPEELNLGAWARMEQQLDEARVQRLVNRKVARLFAAEIGIVAVLLLLWGGYREYLPAAAAPATNAAAASPAAPGGAAAVRSRGGAVSGAAHKTAAATHAAPANAASASSSSAESAEVGNAVPEPLLASAATGAVSAPVNLAAGPASRRKTRRVPLPAVGLTAAEPGAAMDAGEAAGRSTGPRHSRRRHQAEPNAALLAAGTAGRQALVPGAARRERNARWPGSATQATGAPLTEGSGLAVGETGTGSTAGDRSNRGPGHNGGQATTASAGAPPLALSGSNHEGALPPTTEPTTLAAPGAATGGTATGTTAAGEVADDTAALLPLTTPLQLQAAGELPTELPADSIVRRRPRPFVPSRLFITGLYAPELSTVRRAGFERPGHSAGLQVEYLLRPRLRLTVGLLSSMKYYRASSKDYAPARPPLYPIEYIDATCRITDIPVNLRYEAWQGVRYRAFVGAGLSSLLMRDEQYRYIYSGTAYTYTRQVRKGSKHPFSVVNLSAGLERQVSPRWSVQAEPYLKMPLGGVGAGKVRLSSGGVFFGLKYGL